MPNHKKDVGVVYRSDVKPRIPVKAVNGFLQHPRVFGEDLHRQTYRQLKSLFKSVGQNVLLLKAELV